MKIIEKIEIRHFRSFGVETTIADLKNLNIFSGGNDSGKSNILRALDLFFNFQNPGFIFNLNEDFSESEKDRQIGLKKKTNIIEITVHFFSETKNVAANRSDKFAIRRQFNEYGYRGQTYILQKESDDKNSFFQRIKRELSSIEYKDFKKTVKIIGDSQLEINDETDFWGKGNTQLFKTKKSISNTVNRIKYFYVPAIRDRDFFEKLIRDFISRVRETFEDVGMEKLSEVEDSLEKYSRIFFSHAPFLGKDPKFRIPKDLNTFFSQFDIGTWHGSRISFRNRGDGIQAHLVPEFLHFLSSDIKKDGELKIPIGKYFIWAFEEPENSCEYSKAQEIADLLVKYSHDKEHNQIFVTSHAFNFLSLNGEGVGLYRVFKDGDNSSVFGPIPEDEGEKEKQLKLFRPKHIERVNLEQEIGMPELMKKISEVWEKDMEEKRMIQKELNGFKKPTIFTEGKTDVQILQAAYDKLGGASQFWEFCFYNISPTNSGWWCRNLQAFAENHLDKLGKSAICLFDKDPAGIESFNKIKGLPKKSDGILGRKSGAIFIGAILLPIPIAEANNYKRNIIDNAGITKEMYFFEIEDYLAKDSVVASKFTHMNKYETDFNITNIPKIKESSKTSFADFIEQNKATIDFTPFKPLFEQIKNCFK